MYPFFHPGDEPSRRLRRVLILGLLALAAFPATADATHNDNYNNAVVIPPTSLNGYVDDNNDNVGATEQSDESLKCGTSNFGSTLWWAFRPPTNGQLTVTAAGIDSVIWVMPFDASFFYYNDADARCHDSGDFGVSESATAYVRAGHGWNIQVGGYDDGTGAQEGPVTLRTSFIPDRDGDRVLDPNDTCPTDPGPASLGGCRDSDGDGIPDVRDDCDTVRGPSSLGGCPDTDGDGVRDQSDKCPRENARARDKNADGCLDTQRLDRLVDGGFSFSVRRGRLVVTALTIRGAPAGARVVGECRTPKGKRCRGAAGKASVPEAVAAKNVKLFRKRKFRVGTKLTVRVTAKKSVGKWLRWKVVRRRNQITVKRAAGCLSQGSRTLRKRGCS